MLKTNFSCNFQWVEQSEKRREDARFLGEEVDQSMIPLGKGDYGNSFNFKPALGTVSEEELRARSVCAICADIPDIAHKSDVSLLVILDDALLTPRQCGHIFCKECIETLMQNRINSGDDVSKLTLVHLSQAATCN